MSDYDNTAALWKRTPRDTDVAGKKYPHYDGQITLNGKKMKMVAWLNTEKTKDTQPDISLKISEIVPKEELPY